MTRYFTHYWTNSTWNYARSEHPTGLIDHTAGNLFAKRGTQVSDHVYMVTVIQGQLFVLGKLVIGEIGDVETIARQLGSAPDDLWVARDHILASYATPREFDCCVSGELTKQLRFQFGDTTKGLKFDSPDRINTQTLRGVRELSVESAHLLDSLLPPLQPVTHQQENEETDRMDDEQSALDNLWQHSSSEVFQLEHSRGHLMHLERSGGHSMIQWHISLNITGDIAIRKPFELDVMKGRLNPFSTTITLEQMPHGVRLAVLAKGRTATSARQSALFFVGEMLNMMSLHLDTPLYLGLVDEDKDGSPKSVRRIVTQEEWSYYFKVGRAYGQDRPTFAQALRWFRKGMNSEDQIDRLLSLWLALEVIANECGQKKGTTKSPIVNQIISCCAAIWPDQSAWPATTTASWIDDMRKKRNAIAHGSFEIYPESLEAIAVEVDRLQMFGREFLLKWEQRPEKEAKLPANS